MKKDTKNMQWVWMKRIKKTRTLKEAEEVMRQDG